MFSITLGHPISTLDNQILFPAGSILSPDNLDSIIYRSKAAFGQKCPLIRYGSIRDDVTIFMSEPPYNAIFCDEKETKNIFRLMECVNMHMPVLQSLDYFKTQDFYTYRHILTVFAMSTLLSNILIADPMEKQKQAASGPVHDFGKICVPLHILRKSEPLTRKEKNALEHHVLAGYALVGYYFRNSSHVLAEVARDHHERRDGSGYPRGIKLKDRIIEIIAVCDIYDALISPRPYRPIAYDNRTAIEELTGMTEKGMFDRDIVHVLVALNRKVSGNHLKCKISKEKRGATPPQNNYGVLSD